MLKMRQISLQCVKNHERSSLHSKHSPVNSVLTPICQFQNQFARGIMIMLFCCKDSQVCSTVIIIAHFKWHNSLKKQLDEMDMLCVKSKTQFVSTVKKNMTTLLNAVKSPYFAQMYDHHKFSALLCYLNACLTQHYPSCLINYCLATWPLIRVQFA